jgi:hypothetical protein
VQDIGVGELGGQGCPRHIARQRRQGAVAQGGGEGILGQVAVKHRDDLGVGGAHPRRQAVAGADHLGEQVVLRLEMGIEGAAGQPGGQHDVVDVGAGIAAQPEQPGGVLEDLGPDSGGMALTWRHYLSKIIPYVGRHIMWPLQPPPAIPISIAWKSSARVAPP